MVVVNRRLMRSEPIPSHVFQEPPRQRVSRALADDGVDSAVRAQRGPVRVFDPFRDFGWVEDAQAVEATKGSTELTCASCI